MSLDFFKMSQESNDITELLITLTADIVAAHVSNNSVAVSDVSNLISNVHAALSGISGPAVVEEIALEPAVPIRNSIKRDYIVCLDDGKKLKMLKRHLKTAYDMTPEDYRAKWGLSADYPMVAPAYARKRQELAKQIGLGRKPGQKSGRKPKPKV